MTCNGYIIGIPKKPALNSRGKKKCEFKASQGSIELKVLDDICQLCYSETVCAKFKGFSGGRFDITPYNVLRQAAYDEVSSEVLMGILVSLHILWIVTLLTCCIYFTLHILGW